MEAFETTTHLLKYFAPTPSGPGRGGGLKNLVTLLVVTLLVAGAALCTWPCRAAEAGHQSQTLYPAGSQRSFKGPAKYFTGRVSVSLLFPANKTARFSGAYVTFQPGARSAWHLHPAGQHIIVTSGVGRTGVWGGPVREIKKGDVVWCPPGVKHWHGASPNSAMTHLVITGIKDGRNVVWMEKVTDRQYNGK